MGNIQIKQRPKRTTSIFRGRNKPHYRTPFKQVVSPNSPFHRDFSPIRYSRQSTSIHKSALKQESKGDTSRGQPQCSSRISGRKEVSDEHIKMSRRSSEWKQNRYKCEQIIKKVRNFNDFLVQLKKRLKQQCCTHQEFSQEKGRVNMSLKLENEKIQLEKYKKLVHRELSKTHSIQSINIQHMNNGEKMLTIQYDHTITQPTQNTTPQPKEANTPLKQRTSEKDFMPPLLPLKETRKSTALKQSTSEERPFSRIKLKQQDSSLQLEELKSLFKILKQKCKGLGSELKLTQRYFESKDENVKGDWREKGNKVVKLLDDVLTANQESIEMERRVRNLLL